MMLCEQKKKKCRSARVSTRFVDIRRRIRKNANSGDGTEMSPGLKSARIDLKLSGQGNFWGGDHESGVRIAELDFVDEI